MSARERGTFARGSYLTLAFVLLLAAVLLVASGCESLSSDDSGSTTTSALLEPAADISVLFGDWEGTYTPEAAWDENGAVDDPPFELGTSVAMQMELRPWSADAASFGTIGAGDLYPARVASLTLQGDQVTIVAVTQAPGLEDLIGIFTLTLEGDTLSGSDDLGPHVPSGWISASGTTYLTRTAPWDPTATSETTASTAASADGGAGGADDGADDGGADDGGADDGADDGGADDGVEPLPGVEIVPDPEVITLGVDDNWGSGTARVGDGVRVRLTFPLEEGVTDVFCNSTSQAILEMPPLQIARDAATGHIPGLSAHFNALAPGSVDIIVRATRDDGSVYLFWRYHMVVEE